MKHTTASLRLKKGDKVLLLNGKGIQALSHIENITKKRIDFFVESSQKYPSPPHKVILIQGVLKGQRCDWLVEKMTELGLGSIYFTKMKYSVCGEEDAQKRIPRWIRLSRAALKQSGQLFLPTIKVFSSLQQVIENIESTAPVLYFHPQNCSPNLLQTLLQPLSLNSKQNIYLLLGPEGGFHEKEVALLTQRNYKSISFGGYILRGETAALVATSIVQQWLSFPRSLPNAHE